MNWVVRRPCISSGYKIGASVRFGEISDNGAGSRHMSAFKQQAETLTWCESGARSSQNGQVVWPQQIGHRLVPAHRPGRTQCRDPISKSIQAAHFGLPWNPMREIRGTRLLQIDHEEVEPSSINAALDANTDRQHATFEVAARSSREIFGTNSDSSEPGVPSQPS